MKLLFVNPLTCSKCSRFRAADGWCLEANVLARTLYPVSCPTKGETSTHRPTFIPPGHTAPLPNEGGLVLPLLSEWPASGREAWSEMHGRPKGFAGDVDAELAWHRANLRRLPCGSCQDDYRIWINGLLPHLGTAEDYWLATWAFHNDVNRKLGRPELSRERAAAEHGWSLEDSSTP